VEDVESEPYEANVNGDEEEEEEMIPCSINNCDFVLKEGPKLISRVQKHIESAHPIGNNGTTCIWCDDARCRNRSKGYIYPNANSLARHVVDVHIHVLKVPCPECGALLCGRADVLTRHLRGFCSVVKARREEERRRRKKERLAAVEKDEADGEDEADGADGDGADEAEQGQGQGQEQDKENESPGKSPARRNRKRRWTI
jgi:hypothetical protein